jgi:ATP-dependent Clp protease ATP-binding subunit ClpA
MLSRELERYLSEAAEIAKQHKHEFVTCEHILFSFTKSPPIVEILEACGANVQRLKKILEDELKNTPHITKTQIDAAGGEEHWMPEFTLATHRILQRAALQVQSSGKKEVTEAHVLIALFHESNSPAVFLLNQEGVRQFDVIQYFSHGKSYSGNETRPTQASATTQGQQEEPVRILDDCCINLNEKVKKGKSDPVIGRQDVIDRALQVLSRRQKNNPLFVGEPGVGKTAIAEGIAQKIVEGNVPPTLKEAEIFALDMGSLLAGTKFRGDFEAKLKALLKELEKKTHAILMIDEIHTLVGAGATQGGTLDAANLLKPMLSDGRLSCIGTTTHKEYRQHFEKDHALNRRFQRIDVTEPSISDTIEILKGLRPHYESFHNVKYTDQAIEAAAKLSSKYIHGKQLPDKAIDLIDEAGARLQLHPELAESRVIDENVIEKVISSISQIPTGTISLNDLDQLKDLDKQMKAVIFGQDEAINSLVSAIKLSRSGLARDNKPIGCFLFSGPTGVGKTEVCKQLANLMGITLHRFDMSEYMEKHAISRLVGAPPGYVGYEEGGLLTEAINKAPHAVLLFDEIEKAHSDIWPILLQVMDGGRLTDSHGRTSDLRHVVLVMTTNVGALEVAKGRIGLGQEDRSGISLNEVKKVFAPEFLNRLDAIIAFKELPSDIVLQVVDKFLHELSLLLMPKNISLVISQPAKKWLLKKGYDKVYGARPMSRAIEEHIKKPLVDEVLFGQLKNGGEVFVDYIEDELGLNFKFATPKSMVNSLPPPVEMPLLPFKPEKK